MSRNAGPGLAYEEALLFEQSRPGRRGAELSEVDVVRHFTRLSTWNAAVDLGIYPLGSCTMKHNPRINEKLARLPGFAGGHPLQPPELAQGFFELVWRLERQLAEERFMTLARKADELAVEAATSRPELRLASPAAASDRLPLGEWLRQMLVAGLFGLLIAAGWLLWRPSARL